MKIKVCGITRTANALKAVRLGADALGFIFYPASPRYISPQNAAKISTEIPESVTRVAVCVKPNLAYIAELVDIFKFDVLQIHGDFSPSYLANFKNYTVIPALQVGTDFSMGAVENFISESAAVLLDTQKNGHYGGTGEAFDWNLTKARNDNIRLILAGGLNPNNIIAAVKTVKPFAVDLNSGVEISPGIKDHKKLEIIFDKLKEIRGEQQFDQKKCGLFA
ncbi:MAG: phosphoribosylanthranilate isomerase [Calditrichaeota bacterium]|nr:MAG: phosphoribosylanthranilate isomerase [Calditrichota bacterium]